MTERNAIRHDPFDRETYSEAREQFPRLDHSLQTREGQLVTAPALFQDAFLSFYQRTPELVEAAELDTPYQPNRQIIEQLMGTREHAEMRHAGTVGNDLTSAIATASVMDRVIDALPPVDRERINNYHAFAEEARSLLERADTLDGLADDYNAPQMREAAEEARRVAAANIAEVADIAGHLARSEEERGDAVRRAARVALQEAKEEVEALGAALAAFGGGGLPGSGGGDGIGSANARDKVAIARRLRENKKLQQLAMMVGRYVRIALAVQRAKVDNQPSEVSEVKAGNDLAHVLPAELALLGDVDTEDVFMYRFAEAKLMQYEVHASEKVGRGPLIVATDESASMKGALGGATRDLWAKAVALALLAVARKQGRDFAWLHFGSGSEFKAHCFKGGKATPSEAIAAADHFFNGGTSYTRWMAYALAKVEASRFDRADVVLLSDGEADVATMEAKWNATRKERGMRCYAVLVGDEMRAARTMARIADSTFTVADLAGEGDALRSVFGV